MGRTEYAAGNFRRAPFPPEWGVPEGREGSDERRQWIFRMIEEHAGEQAHRQLDRREQKARNDVRLQQLAARKDGPR